MTNTCYSSQLVSDEIQLGSCETDKQSFHGSRPSELVLRFLKARNFFIVNVRSNYLSPSAFRILVLGQALRARNSTYIYPSLLMAQLFDNIPVTKGGSRTPPTDSVCF